ncbi:intraflagellar transport protein 122 [Pycnococcus provasolii]
MRAVVAWSDQVPERDGIRSVCYDLVFSPDGSQVVAAVGSRVVVYDASDGDLLHSLKGHKDSVYCVAYSKDGKRFASGGADRQVIIWTSKAEGILKFSHHDSIQCLAYNPITQQLSSATASDFGLWSPEAKSVEKHKMPAKVLSQSWTADGQYLALGMVDGRISVRDRKGTEKVMIQRTAPIWTLSWAPERGGGFVSSGANDPNKASLVASEVLCVGCWDGTLSFYQLSGNQIGRDRFLGYGGKDAKSAQAAADASKTLSSNKAVDAPTYCDPCSVAYFTGGEYIVVGGTDKRVSLCTTEGVRLTTVAERSSWVWACKPRPGMNFVAVGCEDGSIAMYQLIFSTIHGLYQDRYAYRDYMTDVIIQHLITEQKVRIKCRDYVKKIAVYRDRLAVQLPDRIIIYEVHRERDASGKVGSSSVQSNPSSMHYRVLAKIHRRLECNLLVVTSGHVILCQEKRLHLYGLDGVREREWILDGLIRYIKVVGGPPLREGLLVGLKSGAVLKIFVNAQFPIQLIKHTSAIRCLDLSASRKKLAVVDESTSVAVYDLITKEIVYEDTNANSVAWNTEEEDMFCFSGNGTLSIKTGPFAPHLQRLQGFVVGFKGSKVFCLHYVCMQTVDVPLSAGLYRYVERGEFERAYTVACLGVTEQDWRMLGEEALKSMKLDIARKVLIRVRDYRALDLLSHIDSSLRGRNVSTLSPAEQSYWIGQVHALCGRYDAAAKSFADAKRYDAIVEMYTDLRMFEEARKYAESAGPNLSATALGSAAYDELVRRQAEWSEQTSDHDSAAEMYIKAGRVDRAVQLLVKNNRTSKLLDIVRDLDPHRDTASMQVVAAHFRKNGDAASAKALYVKLGDTSKLVAMHIEAGQWEQAMTLARDNPELRAKVFRPYARWLTENDRFEEALAQYYQAGLEGEARRLLEQLAANAVCERRFRDAAHFFHLLAGLVLKVADAAAGGTGEPITDPVTVETYWDMFERSELYHAYAFVVHAVDDPFVSDPPHTVLNAARFLLARLSSGVEMPFGISATYVVWALATRAEALGAYKLARLAYNRMQTMRVSPALESKLDLASLAVRATPFQDDEMLLPVCYRCGATNALAPGQGVGDVCTSCGALFVRSMLTFEHLPIVEFLLENGLTDVEALKLLEEEPDIGDALAPVGASNGGGGKRGDRENIGSSVQTLELGGYDDELMGEAEAVVSEGMGDAMGGGGMSGMPYGRSPMRNRVASVEDDPFVAGKGEAIVCGRRHLRRLRRSDVLVVPDPKSGSLAPRQYFRIVSHDIPLKAAEGHLYEADEYEMYCLENKVAPISREHTGATADAGLVSLEGIMAPAPSDEFDTDSPQHNKAEL